MLRPIAVPKRIASLVKALLNYQPERIYLFGSWARGEQDDLSDIDLVIIKETSAPFFKRLREAAAEEVVLFVKSYFKERAEEDIVKE